MPIQFRPRQRRASAKSEDGFTLIEVLVVCSLLAVVLGALLAPIAFSEKEQAQDASYAYSQQLARSGVESMVNQIQQAWSILSTSPNSVEMDVNLRGSALQVYYECDIPQPGTSYRECVRVQSAVGGTLPSLATGTVVVANLLNGTVANPVFSFAPDSVAPDYMTATVEVPATTAGTPSALTNSIQFSDGALMRNLNVGN